MPRRADQPRRRHEDRLSPIMWDDELPGKLPGEITRPTGHPSHRFFRHRSRPLLVLVGTMRWSPHSLPAHILWPGIDSVDGTQADSHHENCPTQGRGTTDFFSEDCSFLNSYTQSTATTPMALQAAGFTLLDRRRCAPCQTARSDYDRAVLSADKGP